MDVGNVRIRAISTGTFRPPLMNNAGKAECGVTHGLKAKEEGRTWSLGKAYAPPSAHSSVRA